MDREAIVVGLRVKRHKTGANDEKGTIANINGPEITIAWDDPDPTVKRRRRGAYRSTAHWEFWSSRLSRS